MNLIIANLKMNLVYNDIKNYRTKLENITTNNNVVICPSSLFLPFFKSAKYNLGAQNMYYEDKGSYTGEISSLQLASIGVSHVIIGHSERREYFKEDNDLINKKIIAALRNNLIPILCVGETKINRLENNTYEVINKQLKECLNNVTEFSSIVIAYEPIWAIGTGIMPSKSEINNVVTDIKKQFKDKYNQDIKVIYGGSVNIDNISELNTIDNLDGVLIGSASNDIDELEKIISSIK